MPAADSLVLGSRVDEATERLRTGGSETPRLDAEILAAHVLGIERTGVLAHPELGLSPAEGALFEESVARRAAGEPVAYIRGLKEFYGLAFSIDRRALIPRPETELLVDLALGRIVELLTVAPRPEGSAPLRVADVGTGSGAVAVALAVALRGRRMLTSVAMLATDVSADALAVALENAVAHAVADRIRLREADLLPPGEPPFDLIAANLPYVASAEMPSLPAAARFEPVLALDGGVDGLDPLRALVSRLPGVLAPGGAALLEIGADREAGARAAVLAALPGWRVAVHPDLAGLPRILEVCRP